MKSLKIAASRACPDCFTTARDIVDAGHSDFIDIAAAVLTVSDIFAGMIDEIEATGFGIPIFIATYKEEIVPAEYLPRIQGVFENNETCHAFYGRQLEAAAQKYETRLRPPFFRALVEYVSQGTAPLTARGIRAGSFSAVTRRATSSWISSVKPCFAPTCATPTWQWAIC